MYSKNRRENLVRTVRVATFSGLSSLLVLSCQKETLPIKTSFPFNLSSDPIPKQIYLQDGSIKIRLYLDKSSNYNPTTFNFSHYILVGRGTLSDTAGAKVYDVNEDYAIKANPALSREVLYFRYTPKDTTNTDITFIVRSDQGAADTLDYNFNIAF